MNINRRSFLKKTMLALASVPAIAPVLGPRIVGQGTQELVIMPSFTHSTADFMRDATQYMLSKIGQLCGPGSRTNWFCWIPREIEKVQAEQGAFGPRLIVTYKVDYIDRET